MWQTIIVIMIVAGALFFVGRNFYQKLTRKDVPACDSCGGGCAARLDLEALDCLACIEGPPMGEGSRSETAKTDLGV
ncbi:MAG: FeoB-associated Cys-rich membrane protein [Deltaproteobacteria bacterium]|nr:FeoB-associated Cys-rich membrane protein [Deltaproteobacteria bacterium]